jgi:hypothetical protein
MARCCPWLALSFWTVVAWAQPTGGFAQQPGTEDEAVQRLTGGASRVWVLDKISPIMGTAAEHCAAGLIYRFSAEKSSLTMSECKDGSMVKSTHTWKIRKEGPLDIILTIDGQKEYKLNFRDAGQDHMMRLRSDTASKTTPDTDIEFRLGAD